MRKVILALGAMVALAGCDGRTDAQRINDAMPVGAEHLAAVDAVTAAAVSTEEFRQRFDAELKARMERRPEECGKGYAPGWLANEQSIREALPDKQCFVDYDKRMLRWLAEQRIALLLAAPPLRAIPTGRPPTLLASDVITEASFAERAGVALLQSGKHYSVVDIGTGEAIHRGEGGGAPALSLSRNGRLYVVGHGSDAEVRESATGQLLAVFPGIPSYEFHWVNDVGAVFEAQRETVDAHAPLRQLVFRDFSSGRDSVIPMRAGSGVRVFSIDGEVPRVALLTSSRVGVLELRKDPTGWEAVLKSEQEIDASMGWSRATSGFTADRSRFYGVRRHLLLISQPSMEIDTLSLYPFELQAATATPDPDKLLVAGHYGVGLGAREMHVLSLTDRTLAKLDPSQLGTGRVIYVPVVGRNAAIERTRLRFLDALPSAPPEDANVYLERRELELVQARNARAALSTTAPVAAQRESIELTRARMLERSFRENGLPASEQAKVMQLHGISDSLLAQARAANLRPEPARAEFAGQTQGCGSRGVYPGPVAEAGKTARVEAIGVYEAEAATVDPASRRRVGDVQVRVRASSRPLILALSAYEPVRWVLTLEPGAKLAAVLSGGYHPAEVLGAPDVRVYQMGRFYAYQRNGSQFAALEQEIACWSGKNLDVFQGGYKGSRFEVGG